MQTTLDIAQNHVTLRRAGRNYCGPCPVCGGSATSDRFVVYPDKDDMHCFSCGLHGDAVTLLRKVQGMGCADAHEQIGKNCYQRTCQYWDKCRLGAKANGEQPAAPRKKERQPLAPPVVDSAAPAPFTPAPAETPQHKWQQQAAALIAKAHANLLADQEQIDFLAARGLPIDAIRAGLLGYLPENRYPSCQAWGQPVVLKENGRAKKMFIPSGILIPFFDANGDPHRIRIRRSDPRPGDPRYYWMPGSGNDVPVIGPQARGVVVIESDLDAFMVRWQCRDLDICTIPLGTCTAKPKGWAMQALENALCILVAHDFEPRTNEKTGQYENPGGKGADWWLHQFKRAKRWPVPAGKDPGDYVKDHSGDIRSWIAKGLPPVFRVSADAPQNDKKRPILGATINGHRYVVAPAADQVPQLQRQYPDAVVFAPAEIARIKNMTRGQAEQALLYKQRGGSIDDYVDLLHSNDPILAALINRAAQIFDGTISGTAPTDEKGNVVAVEQVQEAFGL